MKDTLRVLTLINYKGFFLGFHWVHCSGVSSKTSASLMSYHNPNKLMWKWSLYWNRPFRFSLHTQNVTI